MDEQTYAKWGALHRRSVAGEPLSAAEAADYEAGCQELDGIVNYEGDLPRLRKLREQALEARARGQQLNECLARRDAEIAELEARLDSRMRQLLGIVN